MNADTGGSKNYFGAGFFGNSFGEVLLTANTLSASRKRPLGATWPFVKLQIDEEAVTCSIGATEVALRYEDISTVKLTGIGYIVFESNDKVHSFGFASLRINSIQKALIYRGAPIDESFTRFKMLAYCSIVFQLLIPVSIIVLSIVLRG